MELTFTAVAQRYRANNLSVSMTVAYKAALSTLSGNQMTIEQTREIALRVSDSLARGHEFALMTPVDDRVSPIPGFFKAP